MDVFDWLAIATILGALSCVGLGVAWVYVPPARPYIRVVCQGIVWVLALTGTALAAAYLGRRRHFQSPAAADAPSPSVPDTRAEVAEARQAHAESRAVAAEAVADPDTAAGWAAIDAEEARLRAILDKED